MQSVSLRPSSSLTRAPTPPPPSSLLLSLLRPFTHADQDAEVAPPGSFVQIPRFCDFVRRGASAAPRREPAGSSLGGVHSRPGTRRAFGVGSLLRRTYPTAPWALRTACTLWPLDLSDARNITSLTAVKKRAPSSCMRRSILDGGRSLRCHGLPISPHQNECLPDPVALTASYSCFPSGIKE